MTQFLLFVLLGLGPGALIAAIALGVVLTYRGSGVINLATGAVAMLAGYAYWALRTGEVGGGMSTAPALVLSLVFTVAVGTAMELLAFRPLRNASPLAKLVSSLGVLLIAQSVVLLSFGTTAQPQPSVLPQDVVHVFGAVVPVDRFILAAIVIVVALGLAALYRWSRFGLATRAASESEASAILSGLSPARLSLANTLLASLVAGSLGILAASITALDPNTLPLLVVPALAAALLARFTSFAIACAAGIGIGVIDSLVQYASSQTWFPTTSEIPIPGVTNVITFLIIAVALFLRGRALPTRGDLLDRSLPRAPRPEHLVRTGLIVAVVGAVALVVFPYDFREATVNTLIGTMMALSLVVLTGFVGQMSVVQLALAGVSGFLISHLAVDAGIGFPLAPLLGTLGAVVLGVITALSAVRVRGVSLAVVTLAAAVAIEQFWFDNASWGAGDTGSPVPSPHLFGLNLGPSAAFRGLDGNLPSPIYGWVVLAVTVGVCIAVGMIRRGRIGKQMLAVRSNERAAAAVAISSRNVKLKAFAISAFIAGLAGSLYAYNFGSVSAQRFSAFTALSLIAFAYAGGITLISGAAFAGLVSTQALVPYAMSKWFGLDGNWFLLFGGVILIVTLVQNPDGAAGAIYRKIHRRPTFSPDLLPPTIEAAAVRSPAAERVAGAEVLALEGVTVAFGGVHALQGVDLRVREGELVGLIGPNGAGKTTLVDAVTGFVDASGPVRLDGRDVGGLPPHQRASLGMARTWQSTELFDDLDVRENMVVAMGRGTSGDPDQDADEILTLMGLAPVAEALPHELSEGQRKIVGLARAVVGRPRMLFLDEPAAGLDTTESEDLGRLLRAIADRGQSTLLIDHDMGLVLGICDRVIVLEFGQVIADGTPDDVRNDPAVIAAYLGGGSTAATETLEPALMPTTPADGS